MVGDIVQAAFDNEQQANDYLDQLIEALEFSNFFNGIDYDVDSDFSVEYVGDGSDYLKRVYWTAGLNDSANGKPRRLVSNQYGEDYNAGYNRSHPES